MSLHDRTEEFSYFTAEHAENAEFLPVFLRALCGLSG